MAADNSGNPLRSRPKLVRADIGDEFRKAGERIYDPDVIIGGRELSRTLERSEKDEIIIGGTK